jgi:deazaflavin-dependent oxidoreductase (nitroreductase family)
MGTWDWFGKLHKAVYEASGGVLGARLGWIPMLLLTTTGRKSGLERTVPLAYMEDDGAWIVVASNSGQDVHPAWWLNLLREPRGRIRVGRREIDVRAFLATPQERARLWPKLKEVNPAYRGYEKKTQREIPVVLLREERS